MSNEDETERKTGGSPESTPGNQRTGTSPADAFEAALQAGLRSLSDALENLVEEGTSGTGSPTRSPRSRPTAGKRVNRNRRADSTKRKRTKRVREPSSDECFIDTRLTDDEFVVIADIPGASKDDISAGINPRADELVIQKRGTVVGRADLPRSEPESMEAWFNNGVLEVHTRLEDAESLEELPS